MPSDIIERVGAFLERHMMNRKVASAIPSGVYSRIFGNEVKPNENTIKGAVVKNSKIKTRVKARLAAAFFRREKWQYVT